MATIHVCDVCRKEVPSRAELFEVTFGKVDKGATPRELASRTDFERFEVCKGCKRRAYAALFGGGDAK